GFLLSLGRLVAYKRVDLAIRAAETMGMDLLIAGDGPDRRRLERIAGPHTKFLGEVSEQDAARLLSTCRAFVFCGEEDFGIALLEANAHGAPVVYLRRGGPAETMRPGVTGVPFSHPSPDAVVEAIQVACRGYSPPRNPQVVLRSPLRSRLLPLCSFRGSRCPACVPGMFTRLREPCVVEQPGSLGHSLSTYSGFSLCHS